VETQTLTIKLDGFELTKTPVKGVYCLTHLGNNIITLITEQDGKTSLIIAKDHIKRIEVS